VKKSNEDKKNKCIEKADNKLEKKLSKCEIKECKS